MVVSARCSDLCGLTTLHGESGGGVYLYACVRVLPLPAARCCLLGSFMQSLCLCRQPERGSTNIDYYDNLKVGMMSYFLCCKGVKRAACLDSCVARSSDMDATWCCMLGCCDIL
jgi:hypothetical protein